MRRTVLIALAALIALSPATAFAKAKKEPITCGGAIDKAEAEDRDWAATGAKGFWIIDGGSIKSMTALRNALIAAKQNIPVVIGGNFSGWDFRNETFAVGGSCYKETNFSGANFDGVDLFGIGVIKANLEKAIFDNGKLEYALLRETSLQDTKMRGTNLSNARLDGGWDGVVENWDLTGANMTGFRFDCGIMVDDGCALDRAGTKFSGANLTDADISTLPFWGQADYYGAIFNNTKLSPRQLADLTGADFRGPVTLIGGDDKVKLTPQEMATLIPQAQAGQKARESASFDCAKAANTAEKIICDNVEFDLRQQDREMAAVYAYVRPKNPAAGTSQKAWLAKRSKCKDGECISALYTARTNELIKMLGPVELLQPGQSAYYIEDNVTFPNSFTDSPLFAKIAPAVAGASMSEVVLTRDKTNGYTIWGTSVGANAHVCSLSADGAVYDPATGWFSIDGAKVFRAIGDDIEIVGDGSPNEDQDPGSDQYVTCGMRARFGTLVPIAVGQKYINARKAELAKGME